MNSEDLRKMFGLEEKPRESSPGEEVLETTTRLAPTSEYSLVLDEWGKRQGSKLQEESELIQKLLPAESDQQVIADLFGVAFELEPQLVEQGAARDRVRHEFLRSLMKTEEYQSLHQSTELDEVASELAATVFAQRLAKLRGACPDPGSAPGDMECTIQAGKAASEAGDEVESLEQVRETFGMGKGSSEKGKLEPARLASVYRKLRNSPQLRRICEMAGRFRRVAQARQRNKVTHGQDDMVGVVLAGDLGRVLPSELARLGVEELELDTLRRLVENQIQCREYRGVEPVAKGPIIITVDESGSMQGEKVETAKAVALGLAWVARHQKRWCGLVAYSGDTGQRLLALPPGKWNETQLMEWLEEFISGGSCRDVPVVELPEFYRQLNPPPGGKTDVIMITDAICELSSQVQKDFVAWKQEANVKVYTLVVGGAEPSDLEKISERCWKVPVISPEGEAVGEVLSI